jgi:UDP-glucose 4-epimerase
LTSQETNSSQLVLVTGGAGFIGSHLVRRLLSEGFQVRVLDNFATGKSENITEVASKIELIQASITDLDAARAAARGTHCIFHQAAIPSVPRSVADPLGSNETNVTGTLTLLEAARQESVPRFVYAASSSAYGDTEVLPKTETMVPNPLSPYAVAKLAGEGYCRAYHRVHGIETFALRYFNVFGPRQDPKSEYAAVVPKFISALLANEPIPVHGDGEQSRDFTFINNVVDANLCAMRAPAEVAGDVFNIACGDRFTLNELICELANIVSMEPQVHHDSSRVGDVRHSQADVSKARDLLGYQPGVGFREGLERTVEFLRASSDTSSLVRT